MNDKKDIVPSRKKQIEAISKTIGESLGVDTVKVFIKPDNRLKLPDNVMVFQEFAFTASRLCSNSALRVLMYLFSISGYENLIEFHVISLAENLNVHQRTIIRAINELIEYNVVQKFKSKKDGRINDYFINPVAAWRGNSQARQKYMMEFNDKNQLLLFAGDQDQVEVNDSVKTKIAENKDFYTK